MNAKGVFALALIISTGCTVGNGGQALETQEADVTATVTEIARFRDARALASDPAGLLYIVDAASSSVVVVNTIGDRLHSYGGPGSGTYSLLDPADVDPSNGLDLFIADAGNHRIQRFTHDGEMAETIPVPPGDADAVTRRPAGEGRPTAVAVGPAGGLYAVESERGVVIRWEGDRRITRILGLPEAGDGALHEPVDVTVASGGTVFVADAARQAVLVYDGLGSYRRTISGRASGGSLALVITPTAEGEHLLVVGPRAVAVHSISGGLVEVVFPDLSESLVGAAVVGDNLFVLTRTRLLLVE